MNLIPRIEVIGITGLPEIEEGATIATMMADAASDQGTPLQDGDVLVVTQKIVSKAEGRLVDLNTVEPSPYAVQLGDDMAKDPRLVELILMESRAIVRMEMERGILITETRHGFVCANAGIDASNVPGDDLVCLLPVDSDRSARGIRDAIRASNGVDVAVIISDTFGRAWRDGHSDFAIGVAGLDPMKDYRGTLDANGRLLKVTTIAVADELTSAAELVTAKSINVPVAIVRGYPYAQDSGEGVRPLIRDRTKDLFR